ncbi:hypothetical protein MAA_09858 [Metarhizium robertsii ARSEF 23]|nr:uncharacterized protein MAA_09858 [Metarhizium robertsii ARSEF 23]EFY94734.1 hypothetical protein MAA_09858 [Metarhizium robertsii ARSEF 23]
MPAERLNNDDHAIDEITSFRTAALHASAATHVLSSVMSEPGAAPGEASRHASPIPTHSQHTNSNETQPCVPCATSTAIYLIQDSSFAKNDISSPSRTQNATLQPDAQPQPQVFEQLTDAISLQTLALQDRYWKSSYIFSPNGFSQPIEVDHVNGDLEANTLEDDHSHNLEHHQYTVPITTAEPPYVKSSTAHTVDMEDSQSNQTTSQHHTSSPEAFVPDVELFVDTTATNEGHEEPLTCTIAVSARRKELLSAAPRRAGDPLYYRTSAQAASLCPRVVHKSARMRKRYRSTSKITALPKDGTKGRAVAEELDASTCLDG